MSDPGAPDLLRFWFEECQPAQWFRQDPAFDQQVRERFGALCEQALARGWIEAEAQPSRRQFWLMPLMHSEDLAIQEQGLKLFERFTDAETTAFAGRHRDVIAHFGRFPHRNGALGRSSSAEELAFLEQPGSRF